MSTSSSTATSSVIADHIATRASEAIPGCDPRKSVWDLSVHPLAAAVALETVLEPFLVEIAEDLHMV